MRLPHRFLTWAAALDFALYWSRPEDHPTVRQVRLAAGPVWEVSWTRQ